ncbi:hypothetical protein L9F63_024572, partial [Diploptera punctata]
MKSRQVPPPELHLCAPAAMIFTVNDVVSIMICAQTRTDEVHQLCLCAGCQNETNLSFKSLPMDAAEHFSKNLPVDATEPFYKMVYLTVQARFYYNFDKCLFLLDLIFFAIIT